MQSMVRWVLGIDQHVRWGIQMEFEAGCGHTRRAECRRMLVGVQCQRGINIPCVGIWVGTSEVGSQWNCVCPSPKELNILRPTGAGEIAGKLPSICRTDGATYAFFFLLAHDEASVPAHEQHCTCP